METEIILKVLGVLFLVERVALPEQFYMFWAFMSYEFPIDSYVSYNL